MFDRSVVFKKYVIISSVSYYSCEYIYFGNPLSPLEIGIQLYLPRVMQIKKAMSMNVINAHFLHRSCEIEKHSQ